jgi:hypothetical protein
MAVGYSKDIRSYPKNIEERKMERIKIAELKSGEKIKFGSINGEPIIWSIAEQGHKGFPEGAVTVVTDRTLGNITFSPANPLEKDHNRRLYGVNRYKDSYVRACLNSNKFLESVFGVDVLDAIVKTEIKIRQPDIDGGEIDSVIDSLFLLSASEVGLEEEDEEGSLIELFADGKNRRALDIDGARDWWWLRSAIVSYSCDVRYVSTDGSTNYSHAYLGTFGVRPACNLKISYLVSKE